MAGLKGNDLGTYDNYLRRVYFDPAAPGSYSGLQKFWTGIKSDPARPKGLDKKKLRQWLVKQEVYQVHSAAKRRGETESIIVEFVDDQWDADILMLGNKPGKNRNYRYLLGVIDLFTRYAWVRPLRQKTAQETAKAFEDILSEGRKCLLLRTDAGKEFTGRPFQDMLKRRKIPDIRAYGEVKANYIERFFRTLQRRFYQYSYHNNTSKFIDVIQDIVKSYNNTVVSTTGFKPSEVNEDNALALYDKVYTPILRKRSEERVKLSFRVGDLVRLSLFGDRFKRGFTQSWSEEVFEIFAVVKSHPARYKVQDLLGEEIEGSFYKGELKVANATDIESVNWKIEKILSTRRVRGVRKSLVKWYGYSDKFNTLINTADVGKYPRLK